MEVVNINLKSSIVLIRLVFKHFFAALSRDGIVVHFLYALKEHCKRWNCSLFFDDLGYRVQNGYIR